VSGKRTESTTGSGPELIEPPLTALAQPVRDMADRALTLLLERITGRRTEPRRDVFDFELRVRGSSVAG